MFALAGLVSSCGVRPDDVVIDDQDVEVVFLHSADIHSRLIPYQLDVTITDNNLGLRPQNAPFGPDRSSTRVPWGMVATPGNGVARL